MNVNIIITKNVKRLIQFIVKKLRKKLLNVLKKIIYIAKDFNGLRNFNCILHYGKRKAAYGNHMSWFKDLIEIDYIFAVVVKKGITDVTNRFDFFLDKLNPWFEENVTDFMCNYK